MEYPYQYQEFTEEDKTSPQAPAERFLRIGDHIFPLDELHERLGVPKSDEIYLCQKVPAGTLRACVSGCEGDPYPGIDVDLVLPVDDTLPNLLSRSEQPVVTDEETPVRTFLYDRDTYIAYADADIRSDKEWENNPRQAKIMVSGDNGCPEATIHVYSENPYVKYMGQEESC